MRFLSFTLLTLLLPAFTFAQDVCTLSTPGNWTAVCTYSGTLNCTGGDTICDAGDTFNVATVATITGGSTVTTTGAPTVVTAGALIIQGGGRYQYDLTGALSSSGTGLLSVGGSVLEGPRTVTPGFNLTAPDTEDFAALGEVIYCPGDSGSAPVTDCGAGETTPGATNEVAFCWPNADYAAPTVGVAIDYEDWVGAFEVGDWIWFFDPGIPYPGRLPTQTDHAYQVTNVDYANAADGNCLVVDVNQGERECSGTSTCWTLARRAIREVTLTAPLLRGTTEVTVDAGTYAADHEQTGFYLSCPSSSGLNPSWSVIVIRQLDGGGGDDTLQLAQPGLPETIASDRTCWISHGFRRGDPIYGMRPAVIEGTDTTSVGNIQFGSATTHLIRNALFRNVGQVLMQGSSLVPFERIVILDSGTSGGNGLRIDTDSTVWDQVMVAGVDSSQTAHHVEVRADDVTIRSLSCRWGHDDCAFSGITGGPYVRTHLEDVSASYLSNGGTTANVWGGGLIASQASVDEVLAIMFSVDDTLSSAMLECPHHPGSASFTNVLSVGGSNTFSGYALQASDAQPSVCVNRNHHYVAPNAYSASSTGFTMLNSQGEVFNDDSFRDRYWMMDFAVTDFGQTVAAGDGQLIWDAEGGGNFLRGIIARPRTFAESVLECPAQGSMDDIVIWRPVQLDTNSGEFVVHCRNTPAEPVNIGDLLIAVDRSGSGWDAGLRIDETDFSFESVTIEGIRDDASDAGTLGDGIWSTNGTQMASISWGNGPCVHDCTRNIVFAANAPATTVHQPIRYRDEARGDYRLDPTSGPGRAGCGPERYGVTRLTRGHRITGIDPVLEGAMLPSMGRGGVFPFGLSK